MADAKNELVRPGRPTPTYKAGLFSIASSVTIKGTPGAVFDALIQVKDYPVWNTFIPRTTPDGTLGLGSKVLFHVRLDPTSSSEQSSNLQVTVYEQDKRIAWKATDFSSVLKAERIHTITDLGDGTCRYENHETMGGALAYIISWAKGEQLKARFLDWAADLKKYVEGKATQPST